MVAILYFISAGLIILLAFAIKPELSQSRQAAIGPVMGVYLCFSLIVFVLYGATVVMAVITTLPPEEQQEI